MIRPFLLLPLLSAFASAADWPVWRGPQGTGISSESIVTTFPADGPKVLWSAAVGTGFSSFVVAEGRVYTMGWAEDQDTVFCLDAKTGKEVWKHSYAAELLDRYYEGGPGGTPTVDGDKVYTLSKWGDVFCFEAATGKVVWQKQLAKELKVENPEWGFAGAPLVNGANVIVNVGSAGCALEKATGKVVWSSDASTEAGYSTPKLVPHKGSAQLVLANTKAYQSVDPATGKLLWSVDWGTRYGVNAADPVPLPEGKLFISTGYGKGCVMLQLNDTAPPQELWKSRDLRTQMNAALLIGSQLYGIDGDQSSKTEVRCLDAASGKMAWSQPIKQMGSITACQNALIILSGNGELTLAKISPASYEPLCSAQILSGRTWSVPVLANGILYARNAAGDVVALDVKP